MTCVKRKRTKVLTYVKRRDYCREVSEPVHFLPEITLSKSVVLDVAAECDVIVDEAETLGAVGIAVAAEGIKRLVLGRLMGVTGE